MKFYLSIKKYYNILHYIMVRKLTESIKKHIVNKQHYKCANKPGANLKGLENYKCLLWKETDLGLKGIFDEAGYEIDHINEYCITRNDSDDNLQALCKSCHIVKTKRFMMERKINDKKLNDKLNCAIDSNKNNNMIINSRYDDNNDNNSDYIDSGDENYEDGSLISCNAENNNNNDNTKIDNLKINNNYVCELCNKSFATKITLENHKMKNICTKTLINKKFSCKYCSSKFTTSSGMYRHQKYYCTKNNIIVIKN